MRYDTLIYFQRVIAGAYDPETGDYGSNTITEAARYAAVMDTRTETMQLVYGELKQGSLTVYIQNHYTDPFDRIRIGEKHYRVDYRRRLRVKESFVLSEVL